MWLLGVAIMEIFPKFSYFANGHPLCLYYLQFWVNLLIFTDIGLGPGESTLMEGVPLKKFKTTDLDVGRCIICQTNTKEKTTSN